MQYRWKGTSGSRAAAGAGLDVFVLRGFVYLGFKQNNPSPHHPAYSCPQLPPVPRPLAPRLRNLLPFTHARTHAPVYASTATMAFVPLGNSSILYSA